MAIGPVRPTTPTPTPATESVNRRPATQGGNESAATPETAAPVDPVADLRAEGGKVEIPDRPPVGAPPPRGTFLDIFA
ncbi:MAG: hypothetical protein QF654_10690 [Alphaproteobacteria bacterium]|jgi:hypothetical protein|nr:hypothetical protein [Alphaproteobacteria bacterium]